MRFKKDLQKKTFKTQFPILKILIAKKGPLSHKDLLAINVIISKHSAAIITSCILTGYNTI